MGQGDKQQDQKLVDDQIEKELKEIQDSVQRNFISEYEIAAQDICEYVLQNRQIDFTNKLEQENFGRKYKSILKKIKCKYCHSDISKCSHICPEIKDTNIKPQHKRWIWNLIKKETCNFLLNFTKICYQLLQFAAYLQDYILVG